MYRDAIENLWRYQKMRVTPKLYIIFVHLLRFMERVQGFCDLEEGAGERSHKEEARNESQVGAVINIAKKERTKSQFKAMKKSTMVKDTMSEFKKN